MPKGPPVPGGWQGAQHEHWVDSEINTRTKRGLRYQAEARKLLEEDDWLVDEAVIVVRHKADRFWTQRVDFWDAFDLGCRKPGRLKWVQVTRGRANVSHHKRTIERLPDPLPGEEWEVWERRLRGEDGHRPPGRAPGFRVHVYDVPSRTWTKAVFVPLPKRP